MFRLNRHQQKTVLQQQNIDLDELDKRQQLEEFVNKDFKIDNLFLLDAKSFLRKFAKLYKDLNDRCSSEANILDVNVLEALMKNDKNEKDDFEALD